MDKIKNRIWLQVFVIYTRYLIGGAFVFASVIKIKGHRFTYESGLNEPIDSAWHFFETMYQSGLYWKFIGMGQLVAGFLLMTQKYAKLGAIINLPIILNVFVITISYYFALTPVITGLMLVANLFLILWDWDTLKIIVNQTPVFMNNIRLESDKIWQITGLLLFLFTFTYRLFVDDGNMFFWFSICLIIGLVGLIMGLKRRTNYDTV